jgi:hypothetical protein
MAASAADWAGESRSFCLRLKVPSHSAGAGVAGNRFRLPTEELPRPRRAASWLITHSPISTLDGRGDFPHTKRSVPDSPMLRTPPVHREEPLPKVRCWVNQIHGSATRHGCCLWWSPFMEPGKMKADRWERSAYLRQSAWESSRSLGNVWEGASTNGLGTAGGLRVHCS